MKSPREINDLIAKHVTKIKTAPDLMRIPGMTVRPVDNQFISPPYSIDATQAVRLLEPFESYSIEGGEDVGAYVTVGLGEIEAIAKADTLPMAICLAVLNFHKIEVGE
jgi:hypothetical protein